MVLAGSNADHLLKESRAAVSQGPSSHLVPPALFLAIQQPKSQRIISCLEWHIDCWTGLLQIPGVESLSLQTSMSQRRCGSVFSLSRLFSMCKVVCCCVFILVGEEPSVLHLKSEMANRYTKGRFWLYTLSTQNAFFVQSIWGIIITISELQN